MLASVSSLVSNVSSGNRHLIRLYNGLCCASESDASALGRYRVHPLLSRELQRLYVLRVQAFPLARSCNSSCFTGEHKATMKTVESSLRLLSNFKLVKRTTKETDSDGSKVTTSTMSLMPCAPKKSKFASGSRITKEKKSTTTPATETRASTSSSTASQATFASHPSTFPATATSPDPFSYATVLPHPSIFDSLQM